MKSKITMTGFMAVRMLLIILMGAFVIVCFAQPEAPEISIEIVILEDVEYICLSWEQVEGAEAYNVYSSNEPGTEDWGDPIAINDADERQYLEPLDNQRVKFFYVTAHTEPGLPDWMALVDGDLFNGEVTIDPFWISKYQVTQEEWIEVMGTNPSHFADENGFPNHDNLPVENVSWYDAIEFCNRLSMQEGLTPVYSYLDAGTDPEDWPQGWNRNDDNHTNVFCDWEADGYRLPTEAEFHHAFNGGVYDPESEFGYGNPYEYSGSNDIDEVAWYNDNSDIGDGEGRRTHHVGTKTANGLGIYDMSGNVFEWFWDIHGEEYPSGNNNPRGAEEGTGRVFRGGSYNDSRFYANMHLDFLRLRRNATQSLRDTGLRVCRNAP